MKLKLSSDVAALNPDLKESGLVTARLAGGEKIQGLHTDLADVFQTIWNMRAIKNAPAPEREYHFAASVGRDYRFDFAWPHPRTLSVLSTLSREPVERSKGEQSKGCPLVAGLALEVDGGQYLARGGRHNTDSDRAKLNLAAELGWVVLRYSPHMILQSPDDVIEQVQRALRRLQLWRDAK